MALSWPMLVQSASGSELEVVRDQDEWELDPSRHARAYPLEDRLIDSAGVEYRLVFTNVEGRRRNAIEPTGRRLSAREVQSIVERHIASVGAQPDWLDAHLADIADRHKIHATILYLSKLEGPDVSEDAPESE